MKNDTNVKSRLLGKLDSGNGSSSKPEDRWDPEEPGETIVGKVARYEWLSSKKSGDQFLVVDVVSLDDGATYSLPASRASLRDQLEKEHVAVGDTLAVRFTGTYASNYGSQGYAYSIAVEHAEEAPF